MSVSPVRAVSPATAVTSQYMTFRLGQQSYAVDILAVQEIRRYSAPTPLPEVPPHVSGLVNLRGAVVPVFDLRVRFGLPDTSVGRLTVIIVVVIREQSVGLVVDEVTSVLRLAAGGLRPTPAFDPHIDTSFILGIAPRDDGMVTILDVDRLVAHDLGGLP